MGFRIHSDPWKCFGLFRKTGPGVNCVLLLPAGEFHAVDHAVVLPAAQSIEIVRDGWVFYSDSKLDYHCRPVQKVG